MSVYSLHKKERNILLSSYVEQCVMSAPPILQHIPLITEEVGNVHVIYACAIRRSCVHQCGVCAELTEDSNWLFSTGA